MAKQRFPDGRPLPAKAFRVFLLINNTTDDTAAVAAASARRCALPLEVKTVVLPEAAAHAGGARRLAMEWASESLSAEGVICTTDADSQVSPTWIAQIWSALAKGVDAVAGVVEFSAASIADRPFPAVRRLEARYAALQAEVKARFDPDPFDPWPNHIWTWGANLAVTAAAYRAVGGLPAEPLAEDRAFAERLRLNDFNIRHAIDVRVSTSRREEGRAPGGLADLVRGYANDEPLPCDAELEPIRTVMRRASSRRRFRMERETGGDGATLARHLELSPDLIERSLHEPGFGRGWRLLEDHSPALARVRLHPSSLPAEVPRAERIVRWARAGRDVDPADALLAASAGLWSSPAPDAAF